jgi:hypothetical protein
MIEYTPDQIKFVEEFTITRDRLSVEVGLLTQEKESLLHSNLTLSELNATLQNGIDKMNSEASNLGFEQAEKISNLKAEVSKLEADILVLKEKRELQVKDMDEKNNTLINLGILIKSIQSATEDTTSHIQKIKSDLNIFTGRVESASLNIEHESNRVKSFTNELSGSIDMERKENYRRTKEIDDRENAVIGRERMVELQYAKIVDQLKK